MAPRALIVIGTRPEAIKMAPVVDALRARAPDVETRVALTGQHTRLVDQVLEVFALEPDYDLGIMQEGQSLHDVMRLALAGLKGVLEDARPDVVLVEGDTATVFAGALAGFFERTKVGHVEAGLRTGDRWAPFPEEMLRRLTDVVADWHFAPTKRAVEALLAEGLPPEHVHLTGNTVVDALLAVRAQARPVRDPALARVLSEPGARVVLLTAHRRESVGRPLENVFAGVRALADRAPDVHVVYPVHPNPNVAGPARERLADHPRVHLTEPLDYPDLVTALERASLVLTDSGGIQEEAPTLGTPVLVLREKTERPEAVEAGVAERVGTDPDALVARGLEALRRGRTPLSASPYGDGRAGERIADIVVSELTGQPRTTEDWDP